MTDTWANGGTGGAAAAYAFDAGDPVAENNAQRDDARRQRDDAETLRRLLSHRNGRAWMFRLLEACHIWNSPFAPGQPDTTAFALGEQNVGLRLYSSIQAFPDLMTMMLVEARKEDERIVGLRMDEERKRQGEENIAMQMQGYDLPPPGGEAPKG